MLGERAIVARALLLPPRDEFFQSAELYQAHGRLQVGHAVVEADLAVGFDDHLAGGVAREVGHRHAVVTERAQAPGE